MAWNSDPKETRKTEYRSWQVEVGGYGDQSVRDGFLKLDCDTRDLYSIDLLELRYFPNAAEVGDIRVISLEWKDGSRLNDNNKNYRLLAPNPLADGSRILEYNTPCNLYKFNGQNHRPYSQNFELRITKTISSLPLSTDYVVCRMLVTSKHVAEGVTYSPYLEGKILNDKT